MWKLWSALLSKAVQFEQVSDVDHVEDILVSKRVVYDDEWYAVHLLLNDPDYNPDDELLRADPTLEAQELKAEVVIKKTSKVNRLRRNKLLLTDWNNSRPW